MPINLTKDSTTFDFSKKEVGDIRINLNWTQKFKKKSWLGLCTKEVNVDLDLGIFIRFKDGTQTVVQALGNAFGSLSTFPYALLQADDRTGDSEDGEWLIINGNRLVDVDEVLIYAFIYEGVPNWNATNGYVDIHVPGHPTVTTRLEGEGNGNMCAIAKLTQDDTGKFQIKRLDNYYASHSHMDRAHGWGFSWTRGRK